MTTQEVLNEVGREREYQNVKWGTTNDDLNTPYHWSAYIGAYATRNLIGAPTQQRDTEAFRNDMIKVAALAVAAVEAIDRNS